MKFSWNCVRALTVPVADIGGKVLVTRSEPGASQLAEALGAAGFATFVSPVIEIRPIVDPALQRTVQILDRFDVVIFLSGHAVRLGLDQIDEVWPTRPPLTWIAVGETTADLLARRGVAAITPEHESSEGILALPQLSQLLGRRVLICSGRGGRAVLVDELIRRGADVERLELYQRERVPTERAVKHLTGGGPIAVVVIASGDGARAFSGVWRAMQGDPGVVVVAPSQRVAAQLEDLEFHNVVVADGASSTAVIAALNGSLRKKMGKHDE